MVDTLDWIIWFVYLNGSFDKVSLFFVTYYFTYLLAIPFTFFEANKVVFQSNLIATFSTYSLICNLFGFPQSAGLFTERSASFSQYILLTITN